MDRKVYDSKFFGGIDFKDYWDLHSHPLYIRLDKKISCYFEIKELPTEGFTKADSLSALVNYVRKHDWAFLPRYWKVISIEIQAAINIPYTDL